MASWALSALLSIFFDGNIGVFAFVASIITATLLTISILQVALHTLDICWIRGIVEAVFVTLLAFAICTRYIPSFTQLARVAVVALAALV